MRKRFSSSLGEYFFLCLFNSSQHNTLLRPHRVEEKMFLGMLLCQSAESKSRASKSDVTRCLTKNNLAKQTSSKCLTPIGSTGWCHIQTVPINRTIEYIQIAQSFVDSSRSRFAFSSQNRHSDLILGYLHEIIVNISLTHQYFNKLSFCSTRSSKLNSALEFFFLASNSWQPENKIFFINWIRNGAIIVERNKIVTHMY